MKPTPACRPRHDDRHQPRAAARAAARGVSATRATRSSASPRRGRTSTELAALGVRHVPLRERDPVDGAAAATSAALGRADPRVPPAAARHRAHAQPEAGRVRPARGALRRAFRSSSTRCTVSTRSPTTPGPGARSCTGSSGSRRSARRPSWSRTSRTSRCSRGLGVPREKLHLLGNGIDLDRFDREHVDAAARAARCGGAGTSTTTTIVCGVVGRLVWEKGYREVIEAARLLRDRVPAPAHRRRRSARRRQGRGAHRGRHRARPKRSATSTSSASATTSRPCYAAFDLYALASYREGFPRSAMEAAAMGLPGRRDRHPRVSPGGRRRSHRTCSSRRATRAALADAICDGRDRRRAPARDGGRRRARRR